MKKRIFIVILVIILIISWIAAISNRAKNYEEVQVLKVGKKYKLTFKGTRYLMAHDPVSALMGKTYIMTGEIQVPRITGKVQADEIPFAKGGYKILGTITFSGNKMNVDLYYDNYDDQRKDPYTWNGNYTLITSDNVK